MLQDLRVAWRVLAKKPGFTIFAVALIALGIGANTAVFSVLNAVLLRPLPFHEPDELVMIWAYDAQDRQRPVPDAFFQAWKDRTQTIGPISTYNTQSGELVGVGEPERVGGERVSANFFDLMGVLPLAGRGFYPGDALPGADPVMVISYGFWQRRLGGDPEVLGRVVYQDGTPFTIVGVMPPEFYSPLVRKNREFWTPTYDPETIERFQRFGHNLFARLKPGVDFQQAEAELLDLVRGVEIDGADELTPRLKPLADAHLGNESQALVLLMFAVVSVLLMVCANLAQLLLARSQARVREFAARKALGATPWRVFRHVLSEGALLALAGGVAGVVLASWLVPLLRTLAPEIRRIDEANLDYRVLGFCLLATLSTTVLFSLAPGLRLARTSVSDAMRGGTRGRPAFRMGSA